MLGDFTHGQARFLGTFPFGIHSVQPRHLIINFTATYRICRIVLSRADEVELECPSALQKPET